MPALVNIGNAYDAIAGTQDLGVLAIDFDGANRLDTGVVWTPTAIAAASVISWQLWNEDNQTEIAVMNIVAPFTPVARRVSKQVFDISALGLVGLIVTRLRLKSTTASDDLFYFGATLRVRRV